MGLGGGGAGGERQEWKLEEESGFLAALGMTSCGVVAAVDRRANAGDNSPSASLFMRPMGSSPWGVRDGVYH